MAPARALVLVAACAAADAGLSFITVGDWGGAAIEEPSKPYSQNVKDVAAQMAKSASDKGVKFVVNTGDNFYWCGIQNTSDFQVAKDWLEPYKAASLQVPWYGVLGNHEYGYNVSAQIALSKIHPNWVMDDRYYTRRVQLEGSNYATFIFLDTSPCVSEYRSSEKSKWDPCGDYPSCSLSGGSDDFEGPCNFHQNIMTQDCGKQFEWFRSVLAKAPKNDWLIVVGHSPAEEIDEQNYVSEMQNHGFDLYLNGHAHCLTQYTLDGKGAYVTSGAGSLVLSSDQLGGSPAKDRTYNKVHNMNVEVLADASLSPTGHSYKAVFHARKSGFTLHTFSDDYSTLTTDFLDTSGATLHSFQVTKGSSPSPSPSPSPPSPSPSPPSSDCCYYSSASCSKGQTCCSGSGKSYASASTCAQYGKKRGCIWTGGKCVVGNGGDSVDITV